MWTLKYYSSSMYELPSQVLISDKPTRVELVKCEEQLLLLLLLLILMEIPEVGLSKRNSLRVADEIAA